MTAFMGKKNRRIAHELYERLCAGDAGIYDITLALYEAVKRGRRKERKRRDNRSEVVTEGMRVLLAELKHYDEQGRKPFDEAKVECFLHSIIGRAYDLGLKSKTVDPWLLLNNDSSLQLSLSGFRALLGLDDG